MPPSLPATDSTASWTASSAIRARAQYDPAAAVCRAGASSDTCLTAAEASAIRKIWNGPTNAAGERLWFGLERGTPLTRLAGAMPFRIPVSYMQHWVHQNPNFDWRTITESRFAAEFEKSKQKFGAVMGADRADLRAFQRRKGKMIIWHGEADELIFPRGTIALLQASARRERRSGECRAVRPVVHGSRRRTLRRRSRCGAAADHVVRRDHRLGRARSGASSASRRLARRSIRRHASCARIRK